MNKRTLSVVISVFNEEKNIKDCLEFVKFADEIIVVDNGSTDKTASIAEKYTKHIITQENNPLAIDYQKNIGFEKASKDLILNIDADERVTAELKDEILSVLEKKDDVNVGYWIPRKNIIFKKWIQHSLWWPDYQLRLFKRGKGRFVKQSVHKPIEVDGQTAKLTSPLYHENYSSISQYIQKMNQIYTENEAEEFVQKHTIFHWQDAIGLPIGDFLKTFFLQKGYKDGFHGLALSILQAFYVELVVLKAWEKHGFVQYNEENFVNKVNNEIRKSSKEFKFWLYATLIEETRNPLRKFIFRLKRRIK
ncbi:MAG TPA: glycosyltransferase family 2 protein [Patescibacteria group bacterium]|nr:glycosyltransferase family 2 protein [Patescibacteria group bacterium]